jgi:hypothetical protein
MVGTNEDKGIIVVGHEAEPENTFLRTDRGEMVSGDGTQRTRWKSFITVKTKIEIIRYLNGEIPENKLLELVPNAHGVLRGFKAVLGELMKVHGTRITTCVVCGTTILRRRVLAGRPNYCDSERCKKIQKLGHSRPATLDSVPVPTRNCLREIQSYNGGYSE